MHGVAWFGPIAWDLWFLICVNLCNLRITLVLSVFTPLSVLSSWRGVHVSVRVDE
jgi:hypothetical protein